MDNNQVEYEEESECEYETESECEYEDSFGPEIAYGIRKFEKAKSIEEFTELTIDYINGNLKGTNMYMGPIAKETECIKQELIRLNRLGFITYGSQPGKYINGGNYQRAYVSGIILREKFDILCEKVSALKFHIFDVTEKDYAYDEDLMTGWYWVTIVKNIPRTHAGLGNVIIHYDKCYNIYHEIEDKYCFIEIVDNEWYREKYMFEQLIPIFEELA